MFAYIVEVMQVAKCNDVNVDQTEERLQSSLMYKWNIYYTDKMVEQANVNHFSTYKFLKIKHRNVLVGSQNHYVTGL